MAHRFIEIDRNTPLLLPPDLRQWVPEDDLVHFVIEAVNGLRLAAFKINRRGTGSAQYPPRTMLALLIYGYANGLFSSRRIERATYRDVAVRYLTADTHPDHDTICAFRRANLEAFKQAFGEVLQLARQMGLLKVGTVSIDGTHIHANASRDRNVRYDRMRELDKQLGEEVERLVAKAEQADQDDRDDGQKLPKSIARLSKLRHKIRQARDELEREQQDLAEAQQADYQEKLDKIKQRGGYPPDPPRTTPEDTTQRNLTDGDSRLMRKTRRSSYEQAYNAQAAVDADGSMLVLAARVSQCASDAGELEPTIEAVTHHVGQPTCVLADTGYASAKVFGRLEAEPYDLLVAVGRDQNHDRRRFDFRPPDHEKPPRPATDKRLLRMKAKLAREAGKQTYRRRKQTVEPVFGIIKSVLGFRRFLLRGIEKVSGEWSLVTLAYNLKRLHTLRGA